MYTKYLTGNVALMLIFGAFILLAFFIGQERMKRVALSAIVALYAVMQLGPAVLSFLMHYHLAFVNKNIIFTSLFIIITLLLSLGRVEKSRSKGVSVPALVLAFLTAGMLISNGVELMPQGVKEHLITDYNLYAMVVAAKNWWLGLTVAWIIVINLWHRPERHK